MATVGAPSAGGDLGSAPAPGPGASMPQADVLFTLSSMNASLTTDRLTMTDVANTALFSSASRQSGVYTMGSFTNTTAGSMFVSRNGRWLSDPVAVMHANGTAALLQLSNPVYDAANNTVTFEVSPSLLCYVSILYIACTHALTYHVC